jgi:hypothetical protein
VIFQVLKAESMKMTVFWDVGPCSSETDVSEVLAASIIRALSDYTPQHPRRQSSSIPLYFNNLGEL